MKYIIITSLVSCCLHRLKDLEFELNKSAYKVLKTSSKFIEKSKNFEFVLFIKSCNKCQQFKSTSRSGIFFILIM